MEALNNKEISIRPYEKADKEACLLAFKSNIPLYFTEEEVNDFESFLERYQDPDSSMNVKKLTYYYVVVLNGEVIGCGGFGDKDHTQVITLAWGLIHQAFHKNHFGEKLLSFRLAQIKQHHPKASVFIDTVQHTFQFFEKFGFKTTKITKDYYALGLDRYDMVLENND